MWPACVHREAACKWRARVPHTSCKTNIDIELCLQLCVCVCFACCASFVLASFSFFCMHCKLSRAHTHTVAVFANALVLRALARLSHSDVIVIGIIVAASVVLVVEGCAHQVAPSRWTLQDRRMRTHTLCTSARARARDALLLRAAAIWLAFGIATRALSRQTSESRARPR